MINSYKNDPIYPLLEMVVPDYTSSVPTSNNYTWHQNPSLNDLRTDEFSASINYASDNSSFIMFYSTKYGANIQAILSISRTVFVCIVLSVASIMFTSDANTLVLNPIERMLEKVKLIARDPLAAASDEVDNAGVLSMLAK